MTNYQTAEPEVRLSRILGIIDDVHNEIHFAMLPDESMERVDQLLLEARAITRGLIGRVPDMTMVAE